MLMCQTNISHNFRNKKGLIKIIVSVLGREEGYTVKYTTPPDGVPEGEA